MSFGEAEVKDVAKPGCFVQQLTDKEVAGQTRRYHGLWLSGALTHWTSTIYSWASSSVSTGSDTNIKHLDLTRNHNTCHHNPMLFLEKQHTSGIEKRQHAHKSPYSEICFWSLDSSCCLKETQVPRWDYSNEGNFTIDRTEVACRIGMCSLSFRAQFTGLDVTTYLLLITLPFTASSANILYI